MSRFIGGRWQPFERIHGPQHYEVADTLHNLAALLAARGHYQEGEEHYRRSLEIKEKLLGAEYPDAALTRHNLGNMINPEGRFAEAVPLLGRNRMPSSTSLRPRQRRPRPSLPRGGSGVKESRSAHWASVRSRCRGDIPQWRKRERARNSTPTGQLSCL